MEIHLLPEQIPQIIRQWALALHKSRSTALMFQCEIDEADSPGIGSDHWMYESGKLSFGSLPIRNHCTALAHWIQISSDGQNIEPKHLFELAFELWRCEIGHEDMASGRFLALADTKINVLREAASLIREKQLRAFDVLHLVQATLPHLTTIKAEDIVALVVAQYDQTKGDLAAGQVFGVLEPCLVREPKLGWEVHELAKQNISEATQNLYGCSLFSLASTTEKAQAFEVALHDCDSPQLDFIECSVGFGAGHTGIPARRRFQVPMH
jgi:hypothetical protein